ncbi:MAG: hypothetical protein OES09_00055 [Gammaproteobacteria bacterium]|nr:hypothetical protein [Gammaproteobacteria bacterium]
MIDRGKRWCMTREGRKGWTEVWVEAYSVPQLEAQGWEVKQKYPPPKAAVVAQEVAAGEE